MHGVAKIEWYRAHVQQLKVISIYLYMRRSLGKDLNGGKLIIFAFRIWVEKVGALNCSNEHACMPLFIPPISLKFPKL